MQRNYSVSFELLSFRARRRLSLGTTATGVPEEDDVLQEPDESDEGEDMNNVDDHSDEDGVAQAICTVYSTFQCADSFQILSMAVLQPMFTI